MPLGSIGDADVSHCRQTAEGSAGEATPRLAGLGTINRSDRLADADVFTPLPDDWVVGVADVVNSTEAIADGRYKAVNMAGAAGISAVMNAISTRRFAFAFGGDGCAMALPPGDEQAVRSALADTAAFVRDEYGLALRVGLTTVRALREAGATVRAALYAPSPHVAYALFDGGGIALAERWLKAGQIGLAPGPAGARPDLTGLSCRWLPMPARRGVILSVIVREGRAGEFRAALTRVLAAVDAGEGDGAGRHPVPLAGPRPGVSWRGAWLEARASRGAQPMWRRLPPVVANTLLGFVFFTLGLKAGAFDARTYRRALHENADVVKLSDGLLLTLDATPALAAQLEALLSELAAAGALTYGLHRQDAALMTCIVPSIDDHGHFHFIDGAGGGYTAAARTMRGPAADSPGDTS